LRSVSFSPARWAIREGRTEDTVLAPCGAWTSRSKALRGERNPHRINSDLTSSIARGCCRFSTSLLISRLVVTYRSEINMRLRSDDDPLGRSLATFWAARRRWAGEYSLRSLRWDVFITVKRPPQITCFRSVFRRSQNPKGPDWSGKQEQIAAPRRRVRLGSPS